MANNGQLGSVTERSGKIYLRRTVNGKKVATFICDASGPEKLSKADIEKRRLEILASDGLTGEMPEEMKQGITFQVAGSSWLKDCMTRKRLPISDATAKGYQSYLNKLGPMIGSVALAQVTNKTVKEVVQNLAAPTESNPDGLSAKTITEIVAVIKYVVGSILDDEGAPVYPRTWNHDFIDLPVVGKQHQPTFTAKHIEGIIGGAKERYAVLYALLAGTGMRIGEASAIEIGLLPHALSDCTMDCKRPTCGTTISADCKTIYVRKSVWNGKKQAPKTAQAIRDIDVPSALAEYIKDFIDTRKTGFLFQSDSGKPLLQRNILRDSLHRIEEGYEVYNSKGKLIKKVPGVVGHKIGFHAFRRFRETHLELEGLPQNLIDQQTGHKPKHISGTYFKPGEHDKRRQLIEDAGLGYHLPGKKVVEISIPAQPGKAKVKVA